jgi:hypothetical protein
MIRGYQRPTTLEPVVPNEFQWRAAVLAGLIAGVILLVVPSGSPWSGIIFLAPVVMGRIIPAEAGLAPAVVWLIHLAVSVVYGLLISVAAVRFRQAKAFLAGAVVGAILYLINLGIVSALWPSLRGKEVAVAFAHIVFGLIAAGAYRGLLKRTVVHQHAETHAT